LYGALLLRGTFFLSDSIHRTRLHIKQGIGWRTAILLTLNPVVEFIKVDAKTYAEGLRYFSPFKNVSETSANSGVPKNANSFSLNNGSFYSILLPLGLLASIIELPLLHFFIHAKLSDGGTSIYWHVLLLALNLCGILWLLGDRIAVAKNVHIINNDSLILRVGHRVYAELPLFDVINAKHLVDSVSNQRSGTATNPEHVTHVTPFDKPNVLLEIKTSPSVVIKRWGRLSALTQYLCIYVDDPQRFAREINLAIVTA
jgi:hypothetical protein